MLTLSRASVATHLLAFGLGALALRAVQGRAWHEASDDDDEDDDDDDDDDDDEQQAVQAKSTAVRDDYEAQAESDEPFKMLLICNMELYRTSNKTGEVKAVKMSAGKTAAQCSHATLGAYRRGMRLCPEAVRAWLRIGQMKITVKCPTVEELLRVQEQCASAGLNTYLIRDAGHTEIDPSSRTVLAVGPAPASVMNPYTGHLKTY